MKTIDSDIRPAALARFILVNEIHELFNEEAAALDRRAFREWLSFLSDDIVYWVPIRSTRAANDLQH